MADKKDKPVTYDLPDLLDPQDVVGKNLHATVCLMVGLVCLTLLPPNYHPMQEEVDLIFVPLERQLIKRTGVTEVNPDLMDYFLIVIGIVSYAKRTNLLQAALPKRQSGSGPTIPGINLKPPVKKNNPNGVRNVPRPGADNAQVNTIATDNGLTPTGSIPGFPESVRPVEANFALLYEQSKDIQS